MSEVKKVKGCSICDPLSVRELVAGVNNVRRYTGTYPLILCKTHLKKFREFMSTDE